MTPKIHPTILEELRKGIFNYASTMQRAYMVGGCVRDYLMGVGCNDIDVVCDDPERFKDLVIQYCIDNEWKYKEYSMSNGHATVVKFDYKAYKVTVEISRLDTDIHSNAYDRDFTCNAWYWSLSNLEDRIFNPTDTVKPGRIPGVVYIIPCNHIETFRKSPIRIFRAADLISRGYTPSLDLELSCRMAGQYIKTNDDFKVAALQIIGKIFHKLANRELSVQNVVRAFDFLISVKGWSYIDPHITMMTHCIQENKYHHDSVWQHTMEVIYNCYIHDGFTNPNEYDYWAAFLHDIGKVTTKTMDPNGHTHFYDHQTESVRLATDILTLSPVDATGKKHILQLIEHHMDTKPFGEDIIVPRQYKHIRKLQWELGGYLWRHFLILNEADCKASECPYKDMCDHMEHTIDTNTYNVLKAVEDMISHGEPQWCSYKIPVTGDDIIEAFPDVPRVYIGKYIDQLYRVTFSRPSDYETKKQCLHYVGVLIKERWAEKKWEKVPKETHEK